MKAARQEIETLIELKYQNNYSDSQTDYLESQTDCINTQTHRVDALKKCLNYHANSRQSIPLNKLCKLLDKQFNQLTEYVDYQTAV